MLFPVFNFFTSQENRKMNKLMTTMILMMVMHLSFGQSRSEMNSPLVPALYVFGDSLFDSGNNNLLPTLAKADFLPYGMNFHRGPTGRFSNGRTVVDFIAEFLGLPYSPPYLSIIQRVLHPEQLTGLNFASGSCGILPETGIDLGKCLNLPEQIDFFERTVEEELPRHYLDSDDLSNYLAKSVYIISVGSNDYINNYLNKQHYETSKHYSPQSFAKLLIDRLSLQLKRMYNLGARKVIMFEIGPIGCIPSSTRQFKHRGRCVEEFNEFATMFNDNLASMLVNLTSSLQGSDFVLGHAHWLGYDAVTHPSKYDLSDTINACCVTWLNGTSGCIPELRELACRNPDKNYFWDGYHLTETVYKTIASRCFNGSSVCIPKNIKDLVSQA